MKRAPILFLNVLIIATCGLIYELLAGTLASYVLGDSIRQFSFIIGLYLSALGVGAWLSRFINDGLARKGFDVVAVQAERDGFLCETAVQRRVHRKSTPALTGVGGVSSSCGSRSSCQRPAS